MSEGDRPKAIDHFRESYALWRSSPLGRITDTLEHALLFNALDSPAGRTLLDVGCGDGKLSCELARRGARVTGLDVDPDMVAAARENAGAHDVSLQLVAGEAERLPFADAVFDDVVAVTVLCFVGDVERVFMEMNRVLKPGGKIVVGELGKWSLWAAYRRIRGWSGNAIWRRAQFRTAAQLHRLARGAGLTDAVCRGAVYYPPFQFAARLLAPADRWLGERTTIGSAFIVLSATKPRVGDRRGNAMSLYDDWIFPSLLDFVMRQKPLVKYRGAVVGAARGNVLEIGVGSGLNFPFYGNQVERVVGLDPSSRLIALARKRAAAAKVPIELLLGSATAIPLADRSIDTIVLTWTLCSIPDVATALAEMRRVLKPDGELLFVEHGLSPEPRVERWQHRLTPMWRHIAGGCHLDRKMDDLVRAAGFDLKALHTEYAPGPRPLTFMYNGCACRRGE